VMFKAGCKASSDSKIEELIPCLDGGQGWKEFCWCLYFLTICHTCDDILYCVCLQFVTTLTNLHFVIEQ
jgi:hypothetical protein